MLRGLEHLFQHFMDLYWEHSCQVTCPRPRCLKKELQRRTHINYQVAYRRPTCLKKGTSKKIGRLRIRRRRKSEEFATKIGNLLQKTEEILRETATSVMLYICCMHATISTQFCRCSGLLLLNLGLEWCLKCLCSGCHHPHRLLLLLLCLLDVLPWIWK